MKRSVTRKSTTLPEAESLFLRIGRSQWTQARYELDGSLLTQSLGQPFGALLVTLGLGPGGLSQAKRG